MTQTKQPNHYPDKDTSPCNGCSWCCEHTLMPLRDDERIAQFHAEWGHGLKVDRNGRYWAVIYNPCRHLTKDGWCGIYEHPGKPEQCTGFPAEGVTGYQTIYWDDCALMRARCKVPEHCKHLHEEKHDGKETEDRQGSDGEGS